MCLQLPRQPCPASQRGSSVSTNPVSAVRDTSTCGLPTTLGPRTAVQGTSAKTDNPLPRRSPHRTNPRLGAQYNPCNTCVWPITAMEKIRMVASTFGPLLSLCSLCLGRAIRSFMIPVKLLGKHALCFCHLRSHPCRDRSRSRQATDCKYSAAFDCHLLCENIILDQGGPQATRCGYCCNFYDLRL